MSQQYEIRKPNQEELEQVKDYYIELGQDEETAQLNIETQYFVVIPNYITDCPGYRGKLMMVVYGCPEFYECFIWEDGKITKAEIDKGMIK